MRTFVATKNVESGILSTQRAKTSCTSYVKIEVAKILSGKISLLTL